MLVLPTDGSHLVHFNFLGPLRPPAERLFYCGKRESDCHTREHSFQHCFSIQIKHITHNAFFFCLFTFQVPNMPGIFTSLIRFYLFWRFASVNQGSPSYKPMHLWEYQGWGPAMKDEKRWQICCLHGELQQSAPVTRLVFLIKQRDRVTGGAVYGRRHWQNGVHVLCLLIIVC